MPIETLANVLTYLRRDNTNPAYGLIQYIQPIADQLICDFLGFQVGGGDTLQSFTEWYPERNLSHLRDELVDTAPYDMVGGRAVQYGLNALNSQVIQLKQLPVRVITDLRENPNAWNVANPPDFNVTPLIEGLDFYVDYSAPTAMGNKISWSGDVYRLTGAWFVSPWSGRTVQVTYQAGFTATELATGPWPAFYPRVRLASCMTIAKLVKEAEAQAGDSLGGTQTGTSGGAFTSEGLAGYSIGYDGQSQVNNLGWELEMPKAAMRLLERYQRYAYD